MPTSSASRSTAPSQWDSARRCGSRWTRPTCGIRGRCSGLCQWADVRMSPSADRIQRRSRMFEGRHAKTPVTRGAEGYAQRSGPPRIRRNLGLTPYGLPGCRPRWPFGPFRCTLTIPRGVNDEPPSDVHPVQAACRCLRSMTTLRPDPQYPAQAERAVLESSPRPVGGIMWVTFGHLRPPGHIMPDHGGDRGAAHLDLGASRSPPYQADPVDAGAQSDLICAPRLVIVEDSPVAPNGGSRASRGP